MPLHHLEHILVYGSVGVFYCLTCDLVVIPFGEVRSDLLSQLDGEKLIIVQGREVLPPLRLPNGPYLHHKLSSIISYLPFLLG